MSLRAGGRDNVDTRKMRRKKKCVNANSQINTKPRNVNSFRKCWDVQDFQKKNSSDFFSTCSIKVYATYVHVSMWCFFLKCICPFLWKKMHKTTKKFACILHPILREKNTNFQRFDHDLMYFWMNFWNVLIQKHSIYLFIG